MLHGWLHNFAKYFGFTKYEHLPKTSRLSITCTPYVVKKSQADGEKDLVELASSEKVVGLWRFVPENSKWYHVSSEASLLEVEGKLSSFEVKENIDEKLYKKDVIEYCTQPKKICESLQSLLQKHDFEADTYLCFPSPWVVDHLSFSMQKHPLINVFGGIASPSGITRVILTDPNANTAYASFYDNILSTCTIAKNYSDLPIARRMHAMFEAFNEAFQYRVVLKFVEAKE